MSGHAQSIKVYSITNLQVLRSSLLSFLNFLDANRPPRVPGIDAAILSKCVQALNQNIKMPNIPKYPKYPKRQVFNILGKTYWIHFDFLCVIRPHMPHIILLI